MWCRLVFSLTLGLLLIGLLNVVQAPAWSSWRLAVVAGEFGHWLAPLAMVMGIAGWWWGGKQTLFGVGCLVAAAIAAALLFTPAIQASRVAVTLPDMLRDRLGARNDHRRPFSFGELFLGWDAAPVPVQTLQVAGLPLDFYRAIGDTNKAGAPCVILVHGGGWSGGDRKQIPAYNHWLARRGYAVAAISYRLAPQFLWPAQRDDTLAAIAFLKSHAGELGIDPTRLVLIGRSAGGQVALATAYTADDPAIRGVVALYAPSDLIFGYVNTHENDMIRSPALMRQFLGGTPDSARANYESASALFHVGPRTPPTLLLHGQNDALVWHRHSVRLDASLADHGVRHAFVSLPWAGHAFDFNRHGPGGQLTTFALEWFLAQVTQENGGFAH